MHNLHSAHISALLFPPFFQYRNVVCLSRTELGKKAFQFPTWNYLQNDLKWFCIPLGNWTQRFHHWWNVWVHQWWTQRLLTRALSVPWWVIMWFLLVVCFVVDLLYVSCRCLGQVTLGKEFFNLNELFFFLVKEMIHTCSCSNVMF